MQCQKCGTEFNGNFCPKCGNKSDPPPESIQADVKVSFSDHFRIKEIKKQNTILQAQVSIMSRRQTELGFTEYEQTKRALDQLNGDIASGNQTLSYLLDQSAQLQQENEKLEKQCRTAKNKVNKLREIYQSVTYAIGNNTYIMPQMQSDLDEFSPSVLLHLPHMDQRDLSKAFRENEKQIQTVTDTYSSRYTTKANQTIYQLVVIGMRAELQNILTALKYDKLEDALDQVKEMTVKYAAIATSGNQSISGTLTQFIGQMEYLFTNAVKIEYNYYVKKEQAKQEQIAIREQIRQEAADRKALEEERKRVEEEERKFNNELSKLNDAAKSADGQELEALKKRILELQGQLADVAINKEKIATLQNGKAGNIYIISNLGSFGENVFKIGMTRRINPQDRVDELGSASVPFKFDVHSFIFSKDAVDLETELHHRLNQKRVNRVNLKKEFFCVSIDELEKLVMEIDPTAEFSKTMAAEEYRQSLSSDQIYDESYAEEDEEDDSEIQIPRIRNQASEFANA